MLGIAREDWETIKAALAKRKTDLIILATENERLQKEIEGLCLQRLDDLVSSCPYPEQHSQQITDLHDRVVELERELKVTDGLLDERNRVMDAIPECQSHGKQCVPHALRWIAETRTRLETAEARVVKLDEALMPIVVMLDYVKPQAIVNLWPDSLMQANARAALEEGE